MLPQFQLGQDVWYTPELGTTPIAAKVIEKEGQLQNNIDNYKLEIVGTEEVVDNVKYFQLFRRL